MHRAIKLSSTPWRSTLAGWSDARREQWGRRANELEAAGLDWRAAEAQAFEEVESGRIRDSDAVRQVPVGVDAGVGRVDSRRDAGNASEPAPPALAGPAPAVPRVAGDAGAGGRAAAPVPDLPARARPGRRRPVATGRRLFNDDDVKPIDAIKVDCRANGCKARISPDLLMCPTHWRMVPSGIQSAVWAAYQRGQQIGGSVEPTDAWYAAAAAAVETVARLEGKDADNVFRGILERRS